MGRFTLRVLSVHFAFIAAGCAASRPPEIPGMISQVENCAQLAVGEGVVWGLLNRFDAGKHLVRIEPQTNRTSITPLGYADVGTHIAVGEGAVWVSSSRFGIGGEKIVKFDVKTNKVIPLTELASGGYVAVGAGAVWVSQFDRRQIQRINAKTGQVIATIRHGLDEVRLAVGEGAVWMLHADRDSQLHFVSRIDPQTNNVIEKIPIGKIPRGPLYIFRRIVTGSGAVWIAANGNVSRLDPRTKQVSTLRITDDDALFDITAGEGSVWVSFVKDKIIWIAEIDPKTNEIARRIPFGSRALVSLAAGAGALWACHFNYGIWRIPLSLP